MALVHPAYMNLLEHVPAVIAHLITKFLPLVLAHASKENNIHLFDEVWTSTNVKIHRVPDYDHEVLSGHYIITWRTRHYTSEYWVYNLSTGTYTTYVIDEYTGNPIMVGNTFYVITDLDGPRTLYNTMTDESVLIPDFPVCLDIITTVINNKIYMAPDIETSNHIWMHEYDIPSNTWTQLKPLKCHQLVTAFEVNKTLHIIAQYRYDDIIGLYMYKNNQWECVFTGDFSKCDVICVVGDTLYMLDQGKTHGPCLWPINTCTWELGEKISVPSGITSLGVIEY